MERADALGGVLSGGEQQMLTICRTLMGDPALMMVDEPIPSLIACPPNIFSTPNLQPYRLAPVPPKVKRPPD